MLEEWYAKLETIRDQLKNSIERETIKLTETKDQVQLDRLKNSLDKNKETLRQYQYYIDLKPHEPRFVCGSCEN